MVFLLESKKYMINRVDEILNSNEIIKQYFPLSYRIAIPYHTMYWECHPILPLVDANT